MKNTLADNRQMLNVKAVATAGLAPEAIPDNTVGFVNLVSGLTVVPANFAAVPDKFEFIAKVNGKVYHSIDHITKAQIVAKSNLDYTAPQGEIWKTTISCCSCIDTLQLTIGVSNAALIGSIATPAFDFVYEVAPEELKCHCACDGTNKELENNVFTRIIVNKINTSGSSFYKAYAEIPATGIASGGSFPASPTQGTLFEKTGATPGLYIYNSGAWALVGSPLGGGTSYTITDIDTYVAGMDSRNKDANTANHGPMMTLVVEALVDATPYYHDIEANYVYPRGSRLSLNFNAPNSTCVPVFTKTRDMVYEIGAGYDMRAEEFEVMSYYTNLNAHPTLSDNRFQSPDLIYQFENNKNYNVVDLEFHTSKVNTNDGDKKSFHIILGVETSLTSVYTALKNAFGL